jgi:hypothetical protein
MLLFLWLFTTFQVLDAPSGPGVVPGSGISHHLQTQPASLQIGRANPPLFSEREQLRPIGGGI